MLKLPNVLERAVTKPVVLVVDDEPYVRRFLSRVLNDSGYDVETAMDLFVALERLKRPGVAAVVLDMLFVNSNGHSGLDLLRYIRGMPHLVNLPVIVLTGFTLNQEVVAQVEGYRAEVWHKPIDPIDLVHRVHQLIHGTAARV